MKLKVLIPILIMIFGLSFVVVTPLQTIGHATVNVTVKDREGIPIEGALISFYVDGELKSKQTTASDGTCQAWLYNELYDHPIPASTLGSITYTIEVYVSKRGYLKNAGPFTVALGDTVEHVFDDVPTASGEPPSNGEDDQPCTDCNDQPDPESFWSKYRNEIVGYGLFFAGAVWLLRMGNNE